MKKILAILLFPVLSFGQAYTLQYSGSSLYHTQYNGGIGSNVTLKVPVTDASTVFGFDMKGLVRVNSTGNWLEFHNGIGWVKALDTNTTFTKSTVGLGNVDNTSDLLKPLSNATTNALLGKFNNPTGTTLQYLRGDGSLATFPNIPNYTAGTGINIASNVITNTAPDQTVTLTAGNGITITGTYPNFTISATAPVPSISTRTLNSNFTVSSTKVSFVSYTVTCSVTNPLLVGTSSATAFLEYSTNGGSTWLLPSQTGNSSGVGITVTVQLTNGQTGIVSGMIPVNALVRIRTATSGTASVTYVTGQETLY